MNKPVDLFTTGKGKSLGLGDHVMIRVGLETAVMTAGEWAALIARPQRVETVPEPETVGG